MFGCMELGGVWRRSRGIRGEMEEVEGESEAARPSVGCGGWHQLGLRGPLVLGFFLVLRLRLLAEPF